MECNLVSSDEDRAATPRVASQPRLPLSNQPSLTLASVDQLPSPRASQLNDEVRREAHEDIAAPVTAQHRFVARAGRPVRPGC